MIFAVDPWDSFMLLGHGICWKQPSEEKSKTGWWEEGDLAGLQTETREKKSEGNFHPWEGKVI